MLEKPMFSHFITKQYTQCQVNQLNSTKRCNECNYIT